MPKSDAGDDTLKGKEVYTLDEELVGTVTAVFHPADETANDEVPHYFLVEGGRLTGPMSAGSLYVPDSAIQHVEGNRITVPYMRDQLENLGWIRRPAMVDSARRT
jgi:hypothetical protein